MQVGMLTPQALTALTQMVPVKATDGKVMVPVVVVPVITAPGTVVLHK